MVDEPPQLDTEPDFYARQWAGLNYKREPIIVECDHPHPDFVVCPNCLNDLARVLSDLPDLMHQLDDAIMRDVTFVQHGARTDQRDDEAPLPFNDAASQARARLFRAIGRLAELADPRVTLHTSVEKIQRNLLRLGKRAELPDLAFRLCKTVAAAHHVIDSPPDVTFYGSCPKCHHEIRVERVRDGGVIICPTDGCDYGATLAGHTKAVIDAGDERKLTVDELVSSFEHLGQPVTRHQINGWIRREGLARDTDVRLVWNDDGELVRTERFVYRLGDVRAKAREVAKRRGPAA